MFGILIHILQRENNLSPASGVYEFSSRALYAKKKKLPTAEELLALEVQAQVSSSNSFVNYFQCEIVIKSINVWRLIETFSPHFHLLL
jgi:hypothetical protein